MIKLLQCQKCLLFTTLKIMISMHWNRHVARESGFCLVYWNISIHRYTCKCIPYNSTDSRVFKQAYAQAMSICDLLSGSKQLDRFSLNSVWKTLLKIVMQFQFSAMLIQNKAWFPLHHKCTFQMSCKQFQ